MILETLLPQHAGRLRLAFTWLAEIEPSQLQDAIRAIERETAIGPLMNPSAYTDGVRFKNATEYLALFRQLIPLVAQLRQLRGPRSLAESIEQAGMPEHIATADPQQVSATNQRMAERSAG